MRDYRYHDRPRRSVVRHASLERARQSIGGAGVRPGDGGSSIPSVPLVSRSIASPPFSSRNGASASVVRYFRAGRYLSCAVKELRQ